jgi:carboxyl-terminal processing protease
VKQKLIWLVLALATAMQVAKADSEVSYPPLLKPTVQEAKAAHQPAELLSRYHYKPAPLDDALSSKMLDQYLKTLVRTLPPESGRNPEFMRVSALFLLLYTHVI